MLKIVKRCFSFIALLAFYQESQSLVTVTVSDYSVRVLVPINLAVLCGVNLTFGQTHRHACSATVLVGLRSLLQAAANQNSSRQAHQPPATRMKDY